MNRKLTVECTNSNVEMDSDVYFFKNVDYRVRSLCLNPALSLSEYMALIKLLYLSKPKFYMLWIK